MNMIEILLLIDKASKRKIPELTSIEYSSIIKALEDSPLLAEFFKKYRPIAFKNLASKAIAHLQVRPAAERNVHDPIFAEERELTKSWLREQQFFTGDATNLDVRAQYQAKLLTWVESDRDYNAETKAILGAYIPRVFERYTLGATGAENLFAAMECQERDVPSAVEGSTETPESLQAKVLDNLEKKHTLLSCLLESATAYAHDSVKFYPPLNDSCMPGLDERILDAMQAIHLSLNPEAFGDDSLEAQYIDAAVSSFVSRNATGPQASEFLYALYIHLKYPGATIETQAISHLHLSAMGSEPYRMAQDTYISEQIAKQRALLSEYMVLQAIAEPNTTQKMQKMKIRGQIERYLKPDTTPLTLNEETVLAEQFSQAFQRLYESYNHSDCTLEELPASLRTLNPEMVSTSVNKLNLGTESEADSSSAAKALLTMMATVTDLDEEHLEAVLACATGSSEWHLAFQAMDERAQSDGFSIPQSFDGGVQEELARIHGTLVTVGTPMFMGRPTEILQSALQNQEARSACMQTLMTEMTPETAHLFGSDRQMCQAITDNALTSIAVLKKLAFCCAEQGYPHTLFKILESHPELMKSRESTNLLSDTLWQKAFDAHQYTIVQQLLETDGINVNEGVQYGSNAVPPIIYVYESMHGLGDDALAPEYVKMFLAAGADINQKELSFGYTLLALACADNHLELIEMLLKARANVDLANDRGETPLSRACALGHIKIVEMLLAAGAKVDLKNAIGETPLCLACKSGHFEIVERLLAAGASVDLKNAIGDTPLSRACALGHIKVVEMLLAAGAKVDLKNMDDETSLHLACESGHVKIVEMLLAAGAKVDLKNAIGETPLYRACVNNKLQVVERLLAAGAHVNLSVENGTTPLQIACQLGHVKVVEMLIKTGANVNTPDRYKCTPLFRAAQYGMLEIGRMLLDSKANLELPNTHGATPLHQACQSHQTQFVKMLLAAGASVDLKNAIGDTPLSRACALGHIKVVEMLLAAGAKVDLKNMDDETSLHLACESGHVKIVEMLLAAGANINLPNQEGITPLHAACLSGHVDCIQMLVDAGADVNEPDLKGVSPLYTACLSSRIDIVKILLKAQVSVDKADIDGVTPLLIACQYHNPELITTLLEAQANPNQPAKAGDTPLSRAYSSGNMKIIEILVDAGAYDDDLLELFKARYIENPTWMNFSKCMKILAIKTPLHQLDGLTSALLMSIELKKRRIENTLSSENEAQPISPVVPSLLRAPTPPTVDAKASAVKAASKKPRP